MYVVIDPRKNMTFGSFVTFEEARIWGEDNMFKGQNLSYNWYINAINLVQSDCAIHSAPQSSGDGDCC